MALATKAARSSPKRALLEHELTVRVDGPVVALARLAHGLGQLDEALVQREIVPHRVLPALVRALKECEMGLQVLVDLVQRHSFRCRVLYGHDDERYVGEGRFLRFLLSVSTATARRCGDGGASLETAASARLAGLARLGLIGIIVLVLVLFIVIVLVNILIFVTRVRRFLLGRATTRRRRRR